MAVLIIFTVILPSDSHQSDNAVCWRTGY